MISQQVEDKKKTKAFMEKVLKDVSSTFTTAMCAIGDRLGLFKDLASDGPATSVELARRANINERYAREWLYSMNAAEYLEYDENSNQFTLPDVYAPVLVKELGPMFLGGMIEQVPPLWKVMDEVVKAFKDGGGVPYSSYDKFWWEGMERETTVYFEHLLVQQWIPATSEIQSKLKDGISVADLGCGHGRALIKLAKEFPNSKYTGYDIHELSIKRATEIAKEESVDKKVKFKVLDIAKGIPEKFDLITSFDVIHDLHYPLIALKAIKEALKPDGTYLLVDIKSSDNPKENFNPIGAIKHGFSMLYCMTTSLAVGGEGLGTLGMPPSKVNELCKEAGFHTVKQLPINDEFHAIFEIKP